MTQTKIIKVFYEFFLLQELSGGFSDISFSQDPAFMDTAPKKTKRKVFIKLYGTLAIFLTDKFLCNLKQNKEHLTLDVFKFK